MSENISFNSAELGAPVETLGYEQARAELEQVVRQLESGASDLETSIALWERGEALAARCEAWLQGAQGAPERGTRRTGRCTERSGACGELKPFPAPALAHPPTNKIACPAAHQNCGAGYFRLLQGRSGSTSASACSQP